MIERGALIISLRTMIMVSGRSSSSEESSESSSGGAGALLPQGLPNGGGPPHLPQHSSSSPPDQPPLVNNHVMGHQQVQQQQSSSPPQQPPSSTNNPHIPQNHGTTGVAPNAGNGSVCSPPQIEANNHILVTLQEKRIIQEFCHLLEKSKQLFNQLRDLPPHFSTLGAAYNPQNHSNGILTSSHHQILGGSVASSASAGGAGGPGAATLSCQQAYFSRAFDIYTRLWKFQQMHRATLDKKYGLKRWQIGDIASKIGQLYFHYYLRTSELAYLQEAHSFYGAIRARGYYAARSSGRGGHNNAARRDSSRSSEVIGQNGPPGHQESSGLIVKKLRYYARFIVVSLLLRKHNVKDLLRELSLQVENYVATVDDEPEEQLEWNLVLSEIRSFIEADSPVVVVDNCTDKLVDPMDTFLILSHRLPRSELVPKNYRPLNPTKDSPLLSSPTTATSSNGSSYKLHEILIVGNKQDQLKFSELTVDMFRMTQTFERALPVECTATNTSSSERCANNILSLSGDEMISSGYDGGKNPHKYLLYRAPIEQILVTLNAAWSDLPWNGVLLIYISGDPCSAALNQGIATTSLKGQKHHHIKSVPPFDSPKGMSCLEDSCREINCLYPSDLIPLTRKPLFFIVDSDNSGTFLDLTREKNNFGKPLVVLMSPEALSNNTGNNVGSGLPISTRGSIFTLFLHCPLAGLCALAGVKSVSLTTWNQLEHLLNIFLSETFDRILVVHLQEQQDSSNQSFSSSWDVYVKLMPDDFLRLIILRFLFCQVVFELHKDFQNPQLRPKCYPEVSLLNGDDTSRFEELITDMADLIQAKHLFNHLI